MLLINSFNYNFSTNANQQPPQQIRIVESANIKSFSKNFKSNIKLKSNVQRKNNIPTVVKKKSA